MRNEAVVITGVGLVTPAGRDRESSWQGLCSGRSFVRELAAGFRDGIETPSLGAPSVDCDDCAFDTDSEFAGQEPFISLALRAANEAVKHANLHIDSAARERLGCVIGTSKGGWLSYRKLWASSRSPAQRNTFEPAGLFSDCFPSAPAQAVAARWDLHGPCITPVAACATGLMSIARGVELIAAGRCDAVLAGSVDASLNDLVNHSFRRLGVLAHHSVDPTRACRPFSADRNGFVIGEGACVLVLERADRARARSADVLATWLSHGLGSDACHLARLSHDATDLALLIGRAMKEACVRADEIDLISYHGTGTVQNDRIESAAVAQALGPAIRHIPGSSVKGTIGHLLGAAGSVELGATVLALRDGLIPPTLHLDRPDPFCPHDYTPHQVKEKPLTTALKLSLGFGGHLACAIIRRGPPRSQSG